MKLARYGEKGMEKPGLVDGEGRLRDASAFVEDWRGAFLGDDTLARLRPEDMPLVGGAPRLGAPVAQIGKIVGIGLNYRAHAAEAGLPPPQDPIIFMKAASALNGPNDDIILPRGSRKTDWEVELAAVIGKGGKYIKREDALSHVAGYCIANDVSEREYQIERGTQWTKGKSADTFAPLGPWLATRDEIPDPQNLKLELLLNGKRMQRGNSADMIFSIAELVARASEYFSWQAGDVMITGTPPGVGFGQKPPRYLRAGDALTLRIGGLGEQNAVVAEG
ncbi:MAG: fumarylacetoacetate hydrolase family protein [Gammaproteobacteria bacterium]